MIFPTVKLSRMMLLIALVFSVFQTSAQYQQDMIDSLLFVLANQDDDTNKVKILNDLSWEYRKNEPYKASDYASQAKKLGDSLLFTRGVITSLNRLGVIAIYQNKYDKAENLYLKVLELEVEEGYQYGIGRAKNQLAKIYRNKGEYNESINFGLESLAIFEKLKIPRLVAIVSNNIGHSYVKLAKFDKGIYYLFKSLTIKEELKDQLGQAHSHLNLAMLYKEMKNFSKAKESLNKSKNIFETQDNKYELAYLYNDLGTIYYSEGKLDSALLTYYKALRFQKIIELEGNDPAIYNNLGNIYFQLNQLDSALHFYSHSETIQLSLGYTDDLFNTFNNMGDVYYRKKKFNNAISLYKKGLAIAKKTNRRVSELTALSNILMSYSNVKKLDSTLFYNRIYLNLRDSLDQNYRETVFQKEALIEKRQENKLLEKDNLLQESVLVQLKTKNKLNRLLIYGLLIGIILLLVLFFLMYKANKLKQKAKIAEKNQKIEKQKVNELLKKQELKSFNSMLEGQENERKRIAKDLHDRLGSMLSVVKIYFKSVEKNIEELKVENKEQYEKANELLDDACAEVRNIAHNMSSGVLSKFGLVPALEDLMKTIGMTKQINVEFITHSMNDRLENETEIAIYRVIQELISNVLNYAKALELTIQLVKRKNGLNITIEDNGIGFDTKVKRSGLGLKNVASRVDKLEGELNIDSVIGKGTTISIDIPIN